MKSTMTNEQTHFATTKNKHILALASAGAGKTYSIIMFINDKIEVEVKPSEIISFSFTRKAANELKDRIAKHFKSKELDFPFISTIHSFCWTELIKKYYNDIGYTQIPTIIQEFPDEFMDQAYKNYGKKKARAAFNKDFQRLVSKDLQNEDFIEPETISLLEYLVKHNLVMFDFMIHLSNFVLIEHTNKVQNNIKMIKYVIIDEAQDLNPAQYKFAKLLQQTFTNTKKMCNLILVGDFKQSIYGFRGSDPKIINTFVEEFAPEIEMLSYNFRSSPEIVDLANSIAETINLGNDKLEASKFAKHGSNITEGEIYNIYDVEEFLDELKILEQPLHDTCILARTNMVIKSLAKILSTLNIPYYLHTEFDILKRAEVKLLMNLLSLVSHGYNKSLMVEIIKTIKGGVPIKVASAINKCSSVQDVGRMFQDIKKIPEIVSIYNDLTKGIFKDAIFKMSKLLETPKKSSTQIQQSLEKFHRDLNTVKVTNGLDSWMDALEELLFEAQFLEEKQSDKVQLMTVHKSKGLQWKNVLFIYDFNLLEQVENDFYDLEEEKRVVYTAVTRPTTNLTIWDLEQKYLSEFFTKGFLLKNIEKWLQTGLLDKNDFSHF